jgi:hypothetical protein
LNKRKTLRNTNVNWRNFVGLDLSLHYQAPIDLMAESPKIKKNAIKFTCLWTFRFYKCLCLRILLSMNFISFKCHYYEFSFLWIFISVYFCVYEFSWCLDFKPMKFRVNEILCLWSCRAFKNNLWIVLY